MIVLLVILIFAAFVILDLLKERELNSQLLAQGEDLHHAVGEMEPKWAGGFQLPPVLSYHRGHTWVHWISPDQAYVGLDDFARRLIGREASITTPAVGTQVGQGEGVIKVRRHNSEARLLSPLSGEVVGVNPRLNRDPDLPFRDNYGRGWLYKIRSPELFKELQNLLNGTLAQRWMEDTRDRFQHQLMLATGSVIQDGGASIEDIASGLDREEWRALVGEMLMPRSTEEEV